MLISLSNPSHTKNTMLVAQAPRPEVVLVVSRWRPDGYTDPQPMEDPLVLSLRNNLRPPRIPESEVAVDSNASDKGTFFSLFDSLDINHFVQSLSKLKLFKHY